MGSFAFLRETVRGPVIIGLGTMVAVLIFWWIVPDRYQSPTLLEYGAFYEPVARSILAGDGLVLPDGTAALRYPPGHPFILAVAFGTAARVGLPEALAVRLLILGCAGTTAILLFLTGRELWGSRNAFVVPVAFAIYPLFLWLTLQPISELTFLPLLALSIWLFLGSMRDPNQRPWHMTAAGIAVGALMLIRPAAIGLSVVLAVLIIVGYREIHVSSRLARAAFLICGSVLVVLPWEAFAFAQTQRVVPLSTGGPSSIHDGLTFAVRDKGYRTGAPPNQKVAEYMIAVDRAYVEKGSARVFPAAFEAFETHPVGGIQVGLWKTIRAWYGTDSGRWEEWLIAVQIPVLALLALATIRAMRMGGEPRQLAILLVVVVGYFWLVTVAALSIVRYMTPAICIWFLVLPALLKSRRTVEDRS